MGSSLFLIASAIVATIHVLHGEYFQNRNVDNSNNIVGFEDHDIFSGYESVTDGFKGDIHPGEGGIKVVSDKFVMFADHKITVEGTLGSFNDTKVYFKNDLVEAVKITTWYSSDGGSTFKIVSTRLEKQEEKEVCDSNAGHILFYALSEDGQCVWEDKKCENKHEVDGKTLCMKRVNIKDHEKVKIELYPCNE